LFKDVEPDWVPNPTEKDELLKREKPKLLSPTKPPTSVEIKEQEELKKDPNRRKSITFDDIPVIPRDNKAERDRGKSTFEPLEIEDPNQNNPNADSGVPPELLYCYSQVLLILGLKKWEDVYDSNGELKK